MIRSMLYALARMIGWLGSIGGGFGARAGRAALWRGFGSSTRRWFD